MKQELHKHLSAISMHPVKDSERGWYYEAEGAWNLLSTDKKSPHEEQGAQDSGEGRHRRQRLHLARLLELFSDQPLCRDGVVVGSTVNEILYPSFKGRM